MSPQSPTVSMVEVCELLGCGKTRVFELLAEGVLQRAPKFGRRLRIMRGSVLAALLTPPPGAKGPKARRPRAPVCWELSDVPI